MRAFDDAPKDDASRAAPLATGVCERCAVSAAKVENDDALRGVAAFSSENMMNLLWGYDTDAALLKELQHCFRNATVVEEMLCSVAVAATKILFMAQTVMPESRVAGRSLTHVCFH